MSVEAQGIGKVVDVDGNPLRGVIIELRDRGELIAGVLSEKDGLFRFDSASLSAASHIVIRALGHPTRLVPIREALGTDTTRLVVPPLMLPEVVTEATRICPLENDPEAASLWRTFASHYAPVPDSAMLGTGYWTSSGIVSTAEFGRPDTAQLLQRHFAIRTSWTAMPGSLKIQEHGYGRPDGQGSITGEFDGWEFARLGSTEAPHFATASFAANHAFSVLDGNEDSGEITLAFCPRARSDVHIEGTLVGSPETGFHRIQWRFLRDGHVPAGGWAEFVPADSPRRGYLLPIASFYWRRTALASSRYQRFEYYGTWAVGGQEDLHVLIRQWKERYDRNEGWLLRRSHPVHQR